MYDIKTLEKRCAENERARQKQLSKPLGFYKAVYIYMLGGIVGTLWETILNFCCGNGYVWCNGSLFTPFNFVYGVGALVIIACLRNKTNPLEVYFVGAVGGGAVEYILSFLEEAVLGTRSWDYSDLPLNINGRTTLPYMAFWGLLCLVVVFCVYRPLDKFLSGLPEKAMRVTAIIFATIIAVDMLFTTAALVRYAARHAGAAPALKLGELIDKLFGDAFMRRRFPQMKF